MTSMSQIEHDGEADFDAYVGERRERLIRAMEQMLEDNFGQTWYQADDPANMRSLAESLAERGQDEPILMFRLTGGITITVSA